MVYKSSQLEGERNEKIAKQHTQTLQQLPENTLAQKLDYLQTSILLDEASLQTLILAYPRVLGYSIKDNIGNSFFVLDSGRPDF